MRLSSPVFLFNIIPMYRPGISRVFDYGHYVLACVPSSAQRTKQNTLYTSLEGVCGENLLDLDLLYVFASNGTADFARINWKDPGTFSAIDGAAGPTFTTNQGFQGNASTQYLTTQWDPATDGVSFTQDEGGWFINNNNTDPTTGRVIFGSAGNASNNSNGLNGGYARTSTNHSFGVNAAAVGVNAGGVWSGFFHKSRTGASLSKLFKNGVQSGVNDTSASTSLSSQDITLLAHNPRGASIQLHSDCQIGIFGIGASLTGEEMALYDAWNEYFTSL